jgi:hypothetical protein
MLGIALVSAPTPLGYRRHDEHLLYDPESRMEDDPCHRIDLDLGSGTRVPNRCLAKVDPRRATSSVSGLEFSSLLIRQTDRR